MIGVIECLNILIIFFCKTTVITFDRESGYLKIITFDTETFDNLIYFIKQSAYDDRK